MSRQRFVQLLIAAVIAISIGLFLNARRNESAVTVGVPVFPRLAGELSAVSAVSLRKGAPTPTVTLHKSGDAWTVVERADYPADVTKLRKLLMSLGDAKIVEEKTSDPQRFAGIGVDEPAAGATGVEVTVTTSKDKQSLIVGKTVGGGNFVRKPSETRSYSVEPGISADADPKYWVDAHLLNVSSSLIQEVDMKPAGGAAYTLHRPKPAESGKAPDAAAKPADGGAKPADGTKSGGAPASPPRPTIDAFTLDGVPSGRKPLDGPALAPATNMLSSLNADDVAPVGSIDFGQASHATITLTDGTVLTLIGTVVGDKHWIQMNSSTDAALTAKTAGRAFDIAPYRYDGIFKPVEQLLVPKPAPATKESGVTKGPASSQSPASSKLPPRPPKGLAAPNTP